MSEGIQSRRRRRHRPGRHADAAAAARARLPRRARSCRSPPSARSGRELDGRPGRAGAHRGVDPGLRPRAVLGRRLHLGRVGTALRGRGRGGDRQLLALAHERRRAARRQRGQPARRSTPTTGIIANPNCSTMQMVVALKPIHDAAGIERLVISTYQAVSGTGRRAVDELLDQSHALLHEREIAAPEQYAHQIAFNALPHAGSFAPGDDHTDEERKLINETRKILGDPSIRDQRHLRARPRRQRALRGRQRADARGALARAGTRAAARGARRDRRSTTPTPRCTRWRSTPPAATRCSSGASAATPATSAPWTCGSSPTTCARARPRTPCSSPSCCTSAGCWRPPGRLRGLSHSARKE